MNGNLPSSLTSWSEWLSLVVDWPNSSLACGSLSAVRPRRHCNKSKQIGAYFNDLSSLAACSIFASLFRVPRSYRQHLWRNCFLVLRCFLDLVRIPSVDLFGSDQPRRCVTLVTASPTVVMIRIQIPLKGELAEYFLILHNAIPVVLLFPYLFSGWFLCDRMIY